MEKDWTEAQTHFHKNNHKFQGQCTSDGTFIVPVQNDTDDLKPKRGKTNV